MPYRPLPSSTAFYALLEHPPHSRLHLARVAQPRADGAVEVEEQAAVGGVLEVVGVREIEHLDHQLHLLPPGVDGARDAHVPGEVRVILAERIPLQDRAIGADAVLRARGPLPGADVAGAALLRHGLCRVVADAVVEVDLARELHECPAVEPSRLLPRAPAALGPAVLRR